MGTTGLGKAPGVDSRPQGVLSGDSSGHWQVAGQCTPARQVTFLPSRACLHAQEGAHGGRGGGRRGEALAHSAGGSATGRQPAWVSGALQAEAWGTYTSDEACPVLQGRGPSREMPPPSARARRGGPIYLPFPWNVSSSGP